MGKNIIKIFLITGVLLIGFGVSVFLYASTLDQETKKIQAEHAQQMALYKQKIDQQTDVNHLTQFATHLLEINLPDLALINMEKATSLDKNYRDGWLGLGLAQFETKDYKNALSSFQEAEKLDPINPPTYKYLSITYQKLEKTDLAKEAQRKYELLAEK